jgi:hypothetical protein
MYPWVVISLLAKWLEKPHFYHSYTSFSVWRRDHYMSLQRFTTGVCPALLRFPAHSGPFCTMWFRQFTQNVTQTDHIDRRHTHSTEHDTQPITYLISKQTVPYQTRDVTCCPGVSTPMTRSLTDSSMTNHITWQTQTVSTIPNLAQTTASNLTTVTSHHDGWKTITLNTQHKSNSTS